jgi:hypothetical protein
VDLSPVWALLAGGGPPAVIAFGVLSIMRGWLIPRSVHEDRVSDLKATIAALQATNAEREHQIGILLGAPERSRRETV